MFRLHCTLFAKEEPLTFVMPTVSLQRWTQVTHVRGSAKPVGFSRLLGPCHVKSSQTQALRQGLSRSASRDFKTLGNNKQAVEIDTDRSTNRQYTRSAASTMNPDAIYSLAHTNDGRIGVAKTIRKVGEGDCVRAHADLNRCATSQFERARQRRRR